MSASDSSPRPATYVSSRTESPDGGSIQIVDRNNQLVPLSSIWTSSPTTIVIFVRHFLCLDCQDYFIEVWNALAKAKAEGRGKGVKLVVVGCGTIKFGLSLADSIGATSSESAAGHFDLFVDQKREAYRALGLTYGTHVTCHACCCGTVRALWQGLSRCWCITSSGDVKQNGGVFVMHQDGQCVLAHIETIPADHAPVQQVLTAAGID